MANSLSFDEVKKGKSWRRWFCDNFKNLVDKNIVQKITVNTFHKHGIIVGRHPYIFFIIPFLITTGLSVGMVSMKFDYVLHEMYTPWSSQSLYETKIFDDFFNDTGGSFIFAFMVQAKDNGSLLRPEYRKEILNLVHFLENDYYITVDNVNFTFKDLQVNHKDDSTVSLLLLEYYNTTDFPIEYTYPVSKIDGESYYVGVHLRNVSVDSATNVIQNFTTLFMYFNSAKGDEEHLNKLKAWAKSFLNVKKFDVAPNLNFYFWNEEVFVMETVRNAASALPFVALGFLFLTLFAIFISLSKDPTKHKPWECMASILCVLLATGSSFGLMFLIGFSFIGSLVVTPVLVLALGMDVTYITLRNWRKPNPMSSPEDRLAETLAESGPSIVITTLTNILSASIGCVTNIYGIYILSLANALTVSFLFILQTTLFSAALAIGSNRERLQKHGIIFCLTVSKKDNGTTTHGIQNNSDWWYTVSKFVAKCLCSTWCRILVSIILLIYWSTSIYGCTRLKLGLIPEKLILDDSPLTKMLNIDATTYYNVGVTLYIFVLNPPDFNNVNETNKFRAMVNEFELLPGCLGSNTTSLWLRSLDEHLSYIDGTTEYQPSMFYTDLEIFLSMSFGLKWLQYLITERKNNSLVIDKFMFTVIYNYTKDWSLRTKYTDMWRDTAGHYPEFNVTTWGSDNYNFFIDSLVALPSNAIQDIIYTSICMGLVCIIYIPNIFNTVCAIITVLSISVGVFGYMCLWGIDLEPISLTCFLISIGYSVDFTSHISYHYYTSDGKTGEEKLTASLSSIGLPMLETGASTILTIGCLCFGQSYYTEMVFFKIIFLTVLFGLLHGLVILPTFLAWIPANYLAILFAHGRKIQPALHMQENGT